MAFSHLRLRPHLPIPNGWDPGFHGVFLQKQVQIRRIPLSLRGTEKQTAAAPSYRAERGGSRRIQHHLFQKGLYDADADADANDSVMSGEFYEDEDNGTETGADDGDMPYRPGSYRH